MDQSSASQIIDAIGGTQEVARLCQVSAAAVSQWRENGIPNARLMFLKLAKPEVFGDLVSEPSNCSGAMKVNRTNPTEQQERETEPIGARVAPKTEAA